MARKKKSGDLPAQTYVHTDATRKNNPPARLAAEGHVKPMPRTEYGYSPRLPPQLRFDATGKADRLPELLDEATRRPLTPEEARLLADALRQQEPWLEWAGKRERPGFAVDPVAVHIHERVSAQAIIATAARKDVERSLFADPEQDYRDAVRFYEHDVDWANRLILGDSLLVMSSLARREDLAGKVQMIYIDPPYGIKFASNFQPEIGKRDVSDREKDLTREPEMVKAFRDTWNLGVHSYLSYLRDRLRLAKELLADTGSVFVQIGEDNVHRVRSVLDEVFHAESFVSLISFRTTSTLAEQLLGRSADYLLWYAKDIGKIKYRRLFRIRTMEDDIGGRYTRVEDQNGSRRFMIAEERGDAAIAPESRIYRHDNLTSQDTSKTGQYPVLFEGQQFTLRQGHWKTNEPGMRRLAQAYRLGAPTPNSLAYVRYFNDFPLQSYSNVWIDTQTGAFTDTKRYVVQTNTKVVERCLLMTTDPGDLVLDPTCGSGTTAYVAEQWGRRWITIDTSRVALAIARQRLLTAKFDYYRLRKEEAGPAGGFHYKTVPHVTLKSIAQNAHLDPIFAKHEPVLDQDLAKCNAALSAVSDDLRRRLGVKLLDKQRRDGKRAVTDADRRRWELPHAPGQTTGSAGGASGAGVPASAGRRARPAEAGTPTSDPRSHDSSPGGFQHWTIPFDTDPDWPKELQEAVTAYRKAWRAKMDEVNDCIAKNADPEELVDQPEIVRGVVRVSGPFTVEGVQPPEVSLGDVIDTVPPHPQPLSPEGRGEEGEFGGAPEAVGPTFEVREARLGDSPENVEAYLDRMVRLLRTDGVRFLDNKPMRFTRLEATYAAGQGSGFHAEGRWVLEGETDPEPDGPATVGVVFGPQFGPVTEKMIEGLIKPASRRYDALLFAAFSFTAEAQALIAENPHPKLRLHLFLIRPDVGPGMDGLLKEQPGGHIFTALDLPRTRVEGPDENGEYHVVMEGMDVYNPVDNSITPTRADKVAAWFLDSDYDEKGTFCVSQAFFPDPSAWEKLSKALSGVVDATAFAQFGGTRSLPFKRGKHGKVAVKVIDPRGNEAMRVHELTTDEHG